MYMLTQRHALTVDVVARLHVDVDVEHCVNTVVVHEGRV